MKILIVSTLAFALIISPTFAVCTTCNQGNENQQELQNQEGEQQNNPAAENEGEGTEPGDTENLNNDKNTLGQEIQQIRAQNSEELKTIIQEKKQELKAEIQALKDKVKQKVYKNQNAVREAVQALLASEDLVGGIGQRVSAIAKEFNNSVKETIQAEEKIQNRNQLMKLIFGGDKTSANKIERQIEKNETRIQQLKELQEQCNCDQEIKDIIGEQIQNIEQEQDRLQNLAQAEKNIKGLFGWMFGWLKK